MSILFKILSIAIDLLKYIVFTALIRFGLVGSSYYGSSSQFKFFFSIPKNFVAENVLVYYKEKSHLFLAIA